MNNVLKTFYQYANENFKPTNEYRKIIEKVDEHYKSVKETLTKEQLAAFDKFDDAELELTAEMSRMFFEYGFQLGLRLTAESFVYGESNEN